MGGMKLLDSVIDMRGVKAQVAQVPGLLQLPMLHHVRDRLSISLACVRF